MTPLVGNLQEASEKLISTLQAIKTVSEDRVWRINVATMAYEDFFYPIQNTVRVFFKSRDRLWTFLGLGAADTLAGPDAFLKFAEKKPTLFEGQAYFAALRFDEDAAQALEWQDFGRRVLILPIVSLVERNGLYEICLNYRADGLPFNIWLDHAFSILKALLRPTKSGGIAEHGPSTHVPSKDLYFKNLDKVLAQFAGPKQKVVLGRRSSLPIINPVDPAELFLRLRKNQHAFLFFIDLGFKSAFFGASPELLYRRVGRIFETESLAGTRARSSDEKADEVLREELSLSQKDNREHALVSLYIEEKLKAFSATDLESSPSEVRALRYVQHLLKRYRAQIDPDITDEHIINTLHPTPAVCGQDLLWAKEYIRANEGFDRGFYAGPIGLLSKDEAEFSVGIRSALFYKQQLYIYVASGIVSGSSREEWEELSHKEKSMLSIFDDP